MRPLLALNIIIAFTASAETINLIQNGNFENGLTGWTAVTNTFGSPAACGSSFALQPTGSTPCGSILPDPIGGGSAVYSSAQFNAGSPFGEYESAITQTVNVPDDITGVSLTWQSTWAVQYTGSAIPVAVDIISLTDPGTALYNLTCAVPLFGLTSSGPWTDLSCPSSILSILVAHEGEQLQVSFVTDPFVDASSILGVTSAVGFDNIALLVDTPVPEPATSTTVASLLALGFLFIRRNAADGSTSATKSRA
jgi:hypothetical protein